MSATSRMRAALATDDPPNLYTIVGESYWVPGGGRAGDGRGARRRAFEHAGAAQRGAAALEVGCLHAVGGRPARIVSKGGAAPPR